MTWYRHTTTVLFSLTIKERQNKGLVDATDSALTDTYNRPTTLEAQEKPVCAPNPSDITMERENKGVVDGSEDKRQR